MVDNTHEEPEESGSSLTGFSALSILRTMWKRRVRITVAWVFLGLCAFAVVRSLPKVYLAESVVLVDSQKIPEKFVSATVVDDLGERINSIRQMILSSGELNKVVQEFGLYQKERKTHSEEEILEMMRQSITIAMESSIPGNGMTSKRPGAFRIGYQGSDPALVMQVANRITDLYVEQNLITREGQAASTSEFLDAQLHDAKRQLDEMEAAVSSYKIAHNGELPQQETALSGTLNRLQIELEANRDAINRAHQTKVILESSASAIESNFEAQRRAWEQARRQAEATGSTVLPGQPAPASSGTALEVLEEQLVLLRTRLSDKHPEVVRLLRAVENAKRAEGRRLAANAATGAITQPADGAMPNTSQVAKAREPAELERTREQLAGLKAQIEGSDKELEIRKVEQQRISRDLDRYQRRIEGLPIREQEMAQITRDYEMSKENYKSLLDKKMSAEMSLDMERRQQSERFVVLDRARLPEKPIKPKRPQLFAIGLVVGLLLALLLGFGAELRRNVVLGEWELPAGTPVRARLPYVEVPAEP
jgi:polysaccharide chain length determinant protein (PEP-CTERM system associated)